MHIDELVRRNRSIRRFRGDHEISEKTLKELVDLARHSPSAANRQPLKFYLSSEPDTNDLIFPFLSWAGYLVDWDGPEEGERPSAYIMILGDTRISKGAGCDHGIAAQSILLGATERGLGGCMIASIDRKSLAEALRLPGHLDILLVIAIGKPGEEVVVDPLPPDGDIRYWRADDGRHHVPKRSLDEIIISREETQTL